MSVAVRFILPPLGLEPLVDFSLIEVEGAEGLYTLRASGENGPRLFVLDATVHLAAYQPSITDSQCALLELASPDQASVLVVVNPGEGATTVNLMAPIVVNTTTGLAAQIILEGQDWALRADLASVHA